jgi:hypothetical protein
MPDRNGLRANPRDIAQAIKPDTVFKLLPRTADPVVLKSDNKDRNKEDPDGFSSDEIRMRVLSEMVSLSFAGALTTVDGTIDKVGAHLNEIINNGIPPTSISGVLGDVKQVLHLIIDPKTDYKSDKQSLTLSHDFKLGPDDEREDVGNADARNITDVTAKVEAKGIIWLEDRLGSDNCSFVVKGKLKCGDARDSVELKLDDTGAHSGVLEREGTVEVDGYDFTVAVGQREKVREKRWHHFTISMEATGTPGTHELPFELDLYIDTYAKATVAPTVTLVQLGPISLTLEPVH